MRTLVVDLIVQRPMRHDFQPNALIEFDGVLRQIALQRTRVLIRTKMPADPAERRLRMR